MLPNDPLLALRQAKATMAERQYQSGQERLAAAARVAANGGNANSQTRSRRAFRSLVERLGAALARRRHPFRHAADEEQGTAAT
jgi:hypothetical protein